jgi:hypothetical protein
MHPLQAIHAGHLTMNKPLPQSAFFLSPPSSENNGVDFLGLRQANLDMMADLIPGTNNVTPYIRPFSVLSWIFWKFHELCEREEKIAPNSNDVRAFRERIEVLFTWGARLVNAPSVPGKQAEPPESEDGYVDLTFDAWTRVQTSTSLIAALWYGPASKTVTGLGFLDPVRSDFFRTVGQGVLLAESLDRVLRKKPDLYARLLDTLTAVKATEDEARELWALWGVASVTNDERDAFRKALSSHDAVGDYVSALGRRSSTIALARCHLSAAAKPLSADEVRHGMYYAAVDGGVYAVPEALGTARRKWIILQVRQLQRLAFETLLSWCEYKTLNGVHDTDAMTANAEAAFVAEEFELPASKDFSALLASLDSQVSNVDQFVALGRIRKLFCPLSMIATINQQFKSIDDHLAATCIYAIMLCACFAGCFGDEDRRFVGIGGPHRISLIHLRKRLMALGSVSFRQAILFVLEALVISQHLATAVNRFDGQNQRLRLSIEETGLESLVGKPWEPTVTEDRLPTILRLASDCGFLTATPEDRFLFHAET